MLSHEWRELEVLCERISDLRHRYAAAQRTKNVGLIEGLKSDIAKTRRQREQLVQHISARLGSAAADVSQSPESTHPDSVMPGGHLGGPRGDPRGQAHSPTIYGFSDGEAVGGAF